MRQFTYLLQVQDDKGTWTHLIDPHTGLRMYLDVVSVSDTSDAELHGIAHDVMKKLGSIELKRRVLFFPGDRREVTAPRQFADGSHGFVKRQPKLASGDVYGIVEESSDSTTLCRRQFTWALQEAVSKAVDPSGWRMAPTRDGILAGNVSLKPTFTVGDWADAGPRLLQRVLSESGAPEERLYRLLVWDGIVPVAELDADRCAIVFLSI
jgi:hypothetical protein